MDSSHFFSDSFREAESRFLEANETIHGTLQSIPLDLKDRKGNELHIQASVPIERDSEKMLVITSGVHGVEGFFGSAVLQAAMEEWIHPRKLAVRCLFIHAINPYGFAELRRFNEENIDPNRNFLVGNQEYSGAPEGYAELDPFLNPPRPPSAWEPFLLKALWKIQQHGMPTLKQAIAGGQYEYPRGLFFGGHGPSRSMQVLESQFPEWFDGVEQVVHLDFHTGLGSWGECNLLIETPLTRSQTEFLDEAFGSNSYQQLGTDGVAYEARGGFGTWCMRKSGVRDYLFACAEFGTYGPISVLSALRAENQAHFWGEPDSPSTRKVKARLKEVFCPASPRWREQVINRSCELIVNAISRLESQPSA